MPIIITGMHRSGTSLTAAIIRELGIHLGTDQELMSPAIDNPDGFHERRDIMLLNDALLKRAGASWHEPPEYELDFNTQGLEEPRRQLRDKAEAIINPLNTHPRWAIKDPRFCLTLSFWQELIPDAKYLICIRNPLEVAASLAQRQGFDESYSLALWQHYYQTLDSKITPDQHLVIAYQDLLFDSSRSVMRMVKWLGLDPDHQALAAALQRIKPHLRHHHTGDNPISQSLPVPATDASKNLESLHPQVLAHYAKWMEAARYLMDIEYPDSTLLSSQADAEPIVTTALQETQASHLPLPCGQSTHIPEANTESDITIPSAPFNCLPDFLESTKTLNTFTHNNRLTGYQTNILQQGYFTLKSPFDGKPLDTTDSLFLPGNKIAYHFAAAIPFWVITGDIQFGYPLTWLFCPRLRVLIRLAGGATGVGKGIDPVAHWSNRIEQALRERESDKTGLSALTPIIVIGHRNFAHHVWNELSALTEWIAKTSPEERASTRIVPIREPLGHLEQIFPELKSSHILRSDITAKAINNIPGCLVPVGSRIVTQQVRTRVADYLQHYSGHHARRIEQDFISQSKPIFWLSVREHDRTCLNQDDFLKETALKLLDTYPDSGILLDGFAFTPQESDLDTLLAAEQRAIRLGNIIQQLINSIHASHGPDYAKRLCSVSGLPLLDNLYLARYVDFYVCHAGTLQHKLAWLYDIPGIIHTAQDGNNNRSTALWYAGQVEDGIPPSLLPGSYITTQLEVDAQQPTRNRNYSITRLAEATDHIVDLVRQKLPVQDSQTTPVIPPPRKQCLLYGNWQLSKLLAQLNQYPVFTEQYDVITLPPVSRLNSDDLERMAQIIGTTDLFISHWIPENFCNNPQLATQNWLNRLPAEAVAIRVPNLRFSGYHSDLFNFNKRGMAGVNDPWEYHSQHILAAWHKGLTIVETCENLKNGLFGRVFEWQNAWQNALDEVRAEQKLLDINIADYLEQEGKNKLLFNAPNQPTSAMVQYLAHSLLEKLMDRPLESPEIRPSRNAIQYPLNTQAHLQLGCRFPNDPENYTIKGNDLNLETVVTNYFSFYEQHRDIAEWNHQQRIQEPLAQTQTVAKPEVSKSATIASTHYEYRTVHAAQIIPISPPARLDTRSPPHPRLTLKSGRWPDTGVAIIPHGKARLDHPCQYYDAEGVEVMAVFDPTAKRIERAMDGDWLKLEGRVCPVVVPGGGIFAHWLGDLLPALHLVELAGINPNSIDHWILNRKDLAYHQESLEKLGINPNKVIPWSKSLRFIEADELIVPTKVRTHLCMAPWIIEWLRQTFLPDWKQKAQRQTAGLRLYLSRDKGSKRRVINESAVVELLKSYDFSIVYLEELSVAEAANLFVQADIIVAAHGAGLANMVFCRPNTHLIELYSWHISQEYWMTATTLGLNYTNLACPGADGQYYDEIDLDYTKRFAEINSADMIIDCEALGAALDARIPKRLPVAPMIKMSGPYIPQQEIASLPGLYKPSPALIENIFPVFIFAACWRTGSTLLQRVLNTSDKLMIWGEPGYLELIRRIFDMLSRQKSSQEWIWDSIEKNGLSQAWTPNLAPREESVLNALRDFFNSLYFSSALSLKPDCQHWGIKEVRKDAVRNAEFMHSIFPNARFIFLFREPVSCFESIIASQFYQQFTDPLYPMKIYQENLRDVLQLQETKPAYPYLILRHEDLVGVDRQQAIQQLFEFLGAQYSEAADAVISGKRLGGSIHKTPLSDSLRDSLKVLLGSLPEQLGYSI